MKNFKLIRNVSITAVLCMFAVGFFYAGGCGGGSGGDEECDLVRGVANADECAALSLALVCDEFALGEIFECLLFNCQLECTSESPSPTPDPIVPVFDENCVAEGPIANEQQCVDLFLETPECTLEDMVTFLPETEFGPICILTCSNCECIPFPEICSDVENDDEDCDGFSNCDDLDCAENPACIESICNDFTDNDGDGFTDCQDADCAGDPACAPVEVG